ncbi:mandelate racemase/muconate lactonizing enzyme family protein [Bradyrhizobium sp. BR 1432]|uniref:mandelate racemase/muconate lactonizing enzyme family protein n=1 Tax=Bradyrhizobium sp. BR 1432 TaxID=3447966 RepID=UPI003EE66FFD
MGQNELQTGLGQRGEVISVQLHSVISKAQLNVRTVRSYQLVHEAYRYVTIKAHLPGGAHIGALRTKIALVHVTMRGVEWSCTATSTGSIYQLSFGKLHTRDDGMKIARVGFWYLRCTLRRRQGAATGLKSQRSSVFVRIETSDGAVGWGETFGYRVLEQHWRDAAEILVGASCLESNRLVDRIAAFDMPLAGGVDIALWDLKGKIAGLPICALLGGAYRTAQPAYGALLNASEAEDIVGAVIAETEDAVARGHIAVKLRVGYHDVATDIAWVNALMDAIPAPTVFPIDANRSMDLATARRFIRSLNHPERVAWFEEPLPRSNMRAYRELRNSIDVPVSGGESVPADLLDDLIARRELEIINPDVAGHGGLERVGRFWRIADANGVKTIPHCFDGELARVATLHLLASRPDWTERQTAFPTAPLECDLAENPIRDDLLDVPLEPGKDGTIAVPTGPGLGVTINDTVLRKYAVAQL